MNEPSAETVSTQAHQKDSMERAQPVTQYAEIIAPVDKDGDPIHMGDWVSFDRAPYQKPITGIVYGVHAKGYLEIAVAGYGSYGLWPQNAKLMLHVATVHDLQCIYGKENG